MVTDGSRIYFVETPFVSSSLMQVSTLGGETSGIDVPFSVDGIGDISPDRSSLLMPSFSTQENLPVLWALPLPAGTPRRLGGLHGYNGTWSPDGQRILMPMAMIYSSPGLMARNPGSWHHCPAFRGGCVGPLMVLVYAFRCSTRSKGQTRCVAAFGHRMGSISSFNPIRMARLRSGPSQRRGSLFRKTTWEPTQLTTGPLSYFPRRSQRGWKETFAIGSQPRGELARFNQKSQQFEPYLSGISADSVDFSKDGQWVAYVTYPEGNLWRSKADGSERLQLTFAHMQVF